MDQKNIQKLITEALAIEAEDAKEAGTLGYMARSLVQATMPHKSTKGNEFTRKNGSFTLSMMAPSEVGLPFGSMPRLLISWITTEAVRRRDREIILGSTLSGFMRQLGYECTGGRWGSIARLRQQMKRLFSSAIMCSYSAGNHDSIFNFVVADKAKLWWDPKHPNQADIWESSVVLGERFFEEIVRNPVPIDMRALKALKRSPMALDIYCWLTYRMFYLKRPTNIPWELLQMQFGADYARTRDFKVAFLDHLRKVSVVYPEALLEETPSGLLIKPSAPHIPHDVPRLRG